MAARNNFWQPFVVPYRLRYANLRFDIRFCQAIYTNPINILFHKDILLFLSRLSVRTSPYTGIVVISIYLIAYVVEVYV